eukprot:TRINITY_DN7040_c0_g1_i6.p1 TRINITY_DN7040_c0_g1~~TRINITY_DN7040_c0_g1_i6.p1  ORF type:complete len:657 (-),score=159.72 TRINITY_DN7040_c0_g1_i6:617-2587(-)
MLADLPDNDVNNPWKCNDSEIESRRDIRNWRVFSIDPPGCQDIDDALSIQELPGNRYRVGVHIADVTHFVKENSLLDVEARSRGTSVYLVDRRIDMLPTVLSERICSLRSGTDRYALSVIWELDENGKIMDTWFGRTVIRSSYELSYYQAHAILNDNPEQKEFFGDDYAPLKADLHNLFNLYTKIRKKRLSAGGLEFDGPEIKFELNEDGDPINFKVKKELEVMKLIAEFMIFANVSVAKKIYQHFPDSAILRRHPYPREDRFDDLKDAAYTKNIDIDVSSNLTLSKSIRMCKRNFAPNERKMLSQLATRAMQEAKYISSGMFETHEYYHYGLAVPYYTHFTSPIRRYADVIVHRQLLRAVENERDEVLGVNKLEDITTHLNKRNRDAKMVQRDCVKLFQALLLKNKTVISDAIVSKIRANGFLVKIPKYDIDGSVYLSDFDGNIRLPDDCLSNYGIESPVTNFEYIENQNKMIIYTEEKALDVNLLDHLTVKIETKESRSHLSTFELSVVSFGSDTNEVVEDIYVEEIPEDDIHQYVNDMKMDFEIPEKTEHSKNFYDRFQEFEHTDIQRDPLELSIPRKTDYQLVGRRIFQEEELERKLKIKKLEKATEVRTNTANVSTEDKFSDEINEVKRKVRVKVVRRVKVRKKARMKKKP